MKYIKEYKEIDWEFHDEEEKKIYAIINGIILLPKIYYNEFKEYCDKNNIKFKYTYELTNMYQFKIYGSIDQLKDFDPYNSYFYNENVDIRFNESIEIDWEFDDEEMSHDIIDNVRFTNFLIVNDIYDKYVKNIREQHNMYNNSIKDISRWIRDRSRYKSDNLITHAFKWSQTSEGRPFWESFNQKWINSVNESLDIDWEDIDDYEEDDSLMVGDIIEVKHGIKELTTTTNPPRPGDKLSPDAPYSGYLTSYLEDDWVFRVKDISNKTDGTPVIKIEYTDKGERFEDNSFWCWFYADEWQKVHI